VGGRGIFIRNLQDSARLSAHRIFLAIRPFEIMRDKHRVAAVEEFIPLPNEQLLEDVFPHSINEGISWNWDAEKRALKARLEKLYIDLPLESSSQFPKNKITADKWTLGVSLFIDRLQKEFDYFVDLVMPEHQFFLERLSFLAHKSPSDFEFLKMEKYFDMKLFTQSVSDFLLTHTDPQVEFLSFQKFPFEEWKNEFFTFDQIRVINKEAPTEFKTHTGKSIRLEYPKLGDASGNVKLSVRIQEMFGQKTTPSLAWGKAKLTVELLTPGYKPIQTTQDLQNFWAKTYYEIRNPLKARYPKHKWPE